MDLDEMLKYAVWIIFFAVALTGIYLLLKRVGAL